MRLSELVPMSSLSPIVPYRSRDLSFSDNNVRGYHDDVLGVSVGRN